MAIIVVAGAGRKQGANLAIPVLEHRMTEVATASFRGKVRKHQWGIPRRRRNHIIGH
jgi:hypothetical protein